MTADPNPPEHWTNSVESNPPQFSARLTPYRSLGPGGFVLLMGFIAISCVMSAGMFVAMGAWPVMFFMIADIAIIWLAFHLNYRAGRAFEEIAVWRHAIHVRKVAPGGSWRAYSFNPFWTRFNVDRHDEIGITRMTLEGEGKILDIGSFLNPADRESFADAFSNALSKARG